MRRSQPRSTRTYTLFPYTTLFRALPAGDDRTGMAHAAAGRRADAGDEADHRLLAATAGLVLQELGGLFFGRAADLADHDDRLGGFVGEEKLQPIEEVGAVHRIAPEADRRGPSKARSGGARG